MWSPALPQLGSRRALREVWALAWPATVHLSLLTSVFVADRALVGRLHADGLAALHGATTISWAVASVLGAVAVGALATVGGHAGAGRRRAAASATLGSLVLVTGLGACVAALLWLTRVPLLSALFPTLGPTAQREAAAYLAVLLPALPIGLFATTAAACLHGLQDTRTPLVAALLGNGCNLIVSAALIFGLGGLPALGVVGAAVGTAVAFAVQAAWLMPRLVLAMPRGALGDIWRITRPVFGERLAYHGSYLIYAGMVGSIGPVAMAAHQGLLGIEAFSFTIAEGFGVAAGALAAHHVGADRPDRARQSTVAALYLAVTALTACGATLLLAGHLLARWLCCEGIVAHELVTALPIAAVSQPLLAVAVVGCAALRGGGETRWALWITLVGAVFVRLVASHLLIPRVGLAGAWLAATLDWGLQAVVIVLWVTGRLRARWRCSSLVPQARSRIEIDPQRVCDPATNCGEARLAYPEHDWRGNRSRDRSR